MAFAAFLSKALIHSHTTKVGAGMPDQHNNHPISALPSGCASQPAGLDAVAQALVQARIAHQAVAAAPFADVVGNAQQAYAVQDRVAQRLGWWPAQAGAPRYWKSGGPSRTQALLHSPLPSHGVWPSPADASHWPAHGVAVEAEIALRLGRSVTASQAQALTQESAIDWIDAMAVSIELVDFRWQERHGAPDWLQVADAQAHSALVLGAWQPYERRDWAQQHCLVHIGSAPAIARTGSHALLSPEWGLLAWLQHATARFGGVVEAGTVVTTGSWIGAQPAKAGDFVSVAFDGVGQASVQL